MNDKICCYLCSVCLEQCVIRSNHAGDCFCRDHKPPLVEVMGKALYGKSSNPFAEENFDDSDFQDGYRKGEEDVRDKIDSFHSENWKYAWRVIYNEKRSQNWTNWKRGYHAGRLSAVTLKV